LEEIAYKRGYITADKVRKLAAPMAKNQYGQYLLKLVSRE
jgi:glucose-1-phosphate thymidylyltransferase